jgi:hypothetical protein
VASSRLASDQRLEILGQMGIEEAMGEGVVEA